MSRSMVWPIVLAWLLLGSVAGSAWADRRSDCVQTTDLERRIAGCTQIIEKPGRGSASDLASALYNRGWANARKGNYDSAIADYSRAITLNPDQARKAQDFQARGSAYQAKDELQRALADFDSGLALNPKSTSLYMSRGTVYQRIGEFDRAIADFSTVVAIAPETADQALHKRAHVQFQKHRYAEAEADYERAIALKPTASHFVGRAWMHVMMQQDIDRSLADLDKAIALDPALGDAYATRGLAYLGLRDPVRAIAEFDRAMGISPKRALYAAYRGLSFLEKGDLAAALKDVDLAISLYAKLVEGYRVRGMVHARQGEVELARNDFAAALALRDEEALGGTVHTQVRRSLAELDAARRPPKGAGSALASTATTAATAATTSTSTSTSTSASTSASVLPTRAERRIALVIGNSAYVNAERLGNPGKDGRTVAATFRRLGFAEVIERYDLTLAGMVASLKEFGDKSATADWSVVYYAGHGIEMGGVSYLIPVDAHLERDTHVDDEALPLDRVLDKVAAARKLRLVILDACRNNPFATRMMRTSTARSIGRGLPMIEPSAGVLVAYSAKHGTTALDGPNGSLSPFAEAVVRHIEEPGLEINFFFRKVRDSVLAQTGRVQEPFLYGSLSSEALYFKQAKP